MLIALGILCLLAVSLFFFLVSQYNSLVKLKARFENAFAQIEVQLKRRYDLIPNLVEVAKGYLKHENETLTNITTARNTALAALKAAAENPTNSASINALNAAEKNLTTNLGGFTIQMESYPDLKASPVMQQLSEELSSTENRVSFARQAFNDAVTAYNVQRNSFPTALLAPTFGHTSDAALLTFADSEAIQSAPKINF